MTDPVPYEPAENIPPIILPETTPDPFSVFEVKRYVDPPETEVTFEVTIRDYNLDDELQWQLVQNHCSKVPTRLVRTGVVPPTGERDRTVTITLPVTGEPFVGGVCTKLVLAVSDQGWNPTSPPYCAPPEDDEGEPETTVGRVQWWIWVNETGASDGPPVTECVR